MARFSGNVGFIENVLTGTSKWTNKETVRHYYGDETRIVKRTDDGGNANSGITINNEISIVADPYAKKHFFAIQWVEWKGVKWEVTGAEVLYPRLILSLGGIWHGDTPRRA